MRLEVSMPIEMMILESRPEIFLMCPECGASPFRSFLRGAVQRRKRWFIVGPRRKYCSIICSECKEIVGHEFDGACVKIETPMGRFRRCLR